MRVCPRTDTLLLIKFWLSLLTHVPDPWVNLATFLFYIVRVLQCRGYSIIFYPWATGSETVFLLIIMMIERVVLGRRVSVVNQIQVRALRKVSAVPVFLASE